MGDTGDKSWLPKLPDEAKGINDFLLAVSKHGQAEAAQAFVDALKEHDFSTALKARDEIMDFAESTHTLDNIGKGLDLFDKAGKALEIAEAAYRGDYEYAAAKSAAVVGDAFASDFLQGLGPGGVVLDYVAHQSGEVLSDALDEYVQVAPGMQDSEANFNHAAQVAYTSLREYTDRTIREQLDAGRSPEDVQQWARDYLHAHGAIYKDLEHMDGMAPQAGRLTLDQANAVDTTYDTWGKLDPDTRGPLHSEKPAETGNAEFEVTVALTDIHDSVDIIDAEPVHATSDDRDESGEAAIQHDHYDDHAAGEAV